MAEVDEPVKTCFTCRLSSWPVPNERCKICYYASEWEPEDNEGSNMEIKCSNCKYDNEPMVGPHCAFCGVDRKNWTPNENFGTYSITMFDRVIYNDPATIILWKDGTKTVAKCMEGEEYDPEKGFAMAVLKKLFGEDYGKVMKEFVKPELRKRERADEQATTFTFKGVVANSLREAMEKMGISGKEN